MVATIKHMETNFSKLDKFEEMNVRRWQKKMYFLTSMSVVYVLSIPIADNGDDATMKQMMRISKWENDDYMCRGVILNDSRPVMEHYNELLCILGQFTQHKMNMDEATSVFCVIDKLPPSWKDFKHTLKNKKKELTLVALGSHFCIEKSLRAQEINKPKRKNVAGPSVVNMVENTYSTRLNIVNDIVNSTFKSISKLNDSILQHARLGHVYFNRMQDMSKDENVKHESELLELLHGDLCDLHATATLWNKKYFVTFIDDASRDLDTVKKNFFDTYVPVARISTIKLLIALTSIHNLIIHEMDEKTTFLNVSENALDTPYEARCIRRIGLISLELAIRSNQSRLIAINHIKFVSLTDDKLCIRRIDEWGYAGSGIDHYAYSCDEPALIRRIFFAGYDV
nr:zinc finger, CCHC-type [Tanacetum cinerariifolium]